jgi:hypothetical protein
MKFCLLVTVLTFFCVSFARSSNQSQTLYDLLRDAEDQSALGLNPFEPQSGNNNIIITLLGPVLIKINTVSANSNNTRPSLISGAAPARRTCPSHIILLTRWRTTAATAATAAAAAIYFAKSR